MVELQLRKGILLDRCPSSRQRTPTAVPSLEVCTNNTAPPEHPTRQMEERAVSPEEGAAFALEHNCMYHETSASESLKWLHRGTKKHPYPPAAGGG